MEDYITLSNKELDRLEVLQKVLEKRLKKKKPLPSLIWVSDK
jgi:hypothetical protein